MFDIKKQKLKFLLFIGTSGTEKVLKPFNLSNCIKEYKLARIIKLAMKKRF